MPEEEEEVSVRELRQNLSVHLRRVQDGQALAVTSRGTRVALLVPLDGGGRVDRLVAEGRITRPSRPWTDPDPARLDVGLTAALLALRGEDLR